MYNLQAAFNALKLIENIKQSGVSSPKINFKGDWADIFSVSMLLSFISNNSIHPKFCFENEDVRNFLLRMGIKEYGTVNYEDNRQYHNSYGKFIEFRKFSSLEEVDNYLQEIFGILKRTDLNEEDINAIVYISQELMDNVIRHAKSPNGGLLCGMVYPRRKEVEFSIVDCGIGFKGSLSIRKEFQNISDLEAMEIATLKENMDGTCDVLKGGGNGIPYSWKLVNKAGGELIIFSGSAMFKNGSIQKLPYKWNGVAIRFSFPLCTLSKDMIIDIFGYDDIGFPEEDEFLF
jgi:anti-sigma regulatory factor (Ser/Thr protein kinase)